jgi:hypothetical protein
MNGGITLLFLNSALERVGHPTLRLLRKELNRLMGGGRGEGVVEGEEEETV